MSTLFTIFHIIFYSILIIERSHLSVSEPSCKSQCGILEAKYPFGTGNGCGSPRFHQYVSCSDNQLRFTSHTGSYPITSISYDASTITITPPCMSTCTSMQPSPTNFGLDWDSPFQLGPSTLILLSCSSSIYSYTTKGNPICDDSSSNYLCSSIYTCPGVVSLGLPMFPPTNSCCVYSPANFGPKNELDLKELKCVGYSSVASLGNFPTDPVQWEYGVVLKYTLGGLDSYSVAPACRACELSGGVCGYTLPRNSFACVCDSGNTTTDCHSYNWIITSSSFQERGKSWLGFFAASVFFAVI